MVLPEEIQRLHSDVPSRRSQRWGGDTSSVPLGAFSPTDRAALEGLYEKLQGLQSAFEEVGYDGEEAREIFDAIVSSGRWREMLKLARSIQEEPQEEVDRDLFLKVRHDIRGGALTRLLNLFQFAERGMLKDHEFSQSYLRVRDHTKIMRNGVPDLDRERYERDLRERMHDVGLLREKWSESRFFDAEEIVEARVHCDFSGPISDRCVEFAALDRVVYNLMNNAIQGRAGGEVELFLTAGGGEGRSNLLIAVRNQVEEEQARRLRGSFGGSDLSDLLRGGYTTGGQGLGMRICADFVCFAYGVNFEEAIGEGYVGAKLEEQNFIAWVHWPVVGG